MSEKKFDLREKLNSLKANRAAVITLTMLVLAFAVIITVAVATNRTKQDDGDNLPPPSETPKVTEPSDKTPEPEKESQKEPEKNDTPTVTPVEDKIPSFALPVSGTVTNKHDPTLQVFSNTMEDYRVHIGVDINTDEGAPVYAAADGKVSKIWEDTKMGYCIAIEHSGDCFTIYKNLSKEVPEGISEGAKVRAGQLIASVGDSAMVEIADEPHLHFEMTVGDLSVDPLKYFEEQALNSLGIDASYEK
ncbi:MAG: peptidoglycan DD-metalloendopeptidase family protein [Clostridia bacterium]|jgi:murein DD-endopeptidase MepM/ murein hydrolase activator NlpD|nr:peptidoglycan DD-metalloendopeptidase family protein [Clostridia bacterium]